MKIQLKEITVRELTNGYEDNGHDGVVGFGGKLDIRPPYQREFIYKGKQRDAVIDTLKKNYPLNVMYWAVREDGDLEIIDGQQRTISVCQYVKGFFSFEYLFFYNLQNDQQEAILDYKLTVYYCSGNDSEKLEWFKTINIAGAELTNQELRNAVYSGSWVTDAKRYFSRRNSAAHGLGGDYLSGVAIRQEYLETAIKWISKDKIEDYMGKHQHEKSAEELWAYFRKVIAWVEKIFTNYRREMKGIQWGFLYDEYKNKKFDSVKLENEISKLMEDEDVTKKSGIYQFVLTRDEKHLSIRAFTDKQKREAFEKQKGICAKCNGRFKIGGMEADHITPWHEGGKTLAENCQMLCKKCNRKKAGK